MTLDELKLILDSLSELEPNVEKFSWGPTYSFAEERRKEAMRLVRKELSSLRKKPIITLVTD